MADYSKTKLTDKLGIKAGYKIYLLNEPSESSNLIGKDPLQKTCGKKKLVKEFDFMHIFIKQRKELENKFSNYKNHLSKKGILWISWPKITSKVQTDLNENFICEIGLNEGLVDVKICPIDKIWS